jgi:hypothetical protein
MGVRYHIWEHPTGCDKMAQHFLLSAEARTLSIGAVARMTDLQVKATFRAIR